ncbi:MAG: nitronate monooxygenase [Chloroflexi bacterium]|nr:nitronate monooxygenase [Chloroflexota bacterium]
MKTRVTELLGIRHPIIQAGMAWVSFPPLVAAVSDAGGLGILSAGPMTPEEVEADIRKIKQLTNKPFGVNFFPDNPRLEEILDVIVAEKVKVVSYGIGNPGRIMARTRSAGIVNMPTMGSLRHAVKAEQDGADMVMVQGTEAGGHCSHVATSVLVPLVVDHVSIPVIAAGGFCDGRGLAAALAWGAEAISMGTRFIITKECPVPENVKQYYLTACEEDTVVTGHVTGVRCRVLHNKLADAFLALEEKKAPPRAIMELGYGRFRRAFHEGDEAWGSLAAGQVIGRIRDVPTCRELIERVVSEAEATINSLSRYAPAPVGSQRQR